MAYIRKIVRKKGTVYRVEVSLFDGSKKAKNFRTKAEAESWGRAEDDAKHSNRSGGIVSVRITLDDYFEKWFLDYATHHHSPGWLTSDRSMYRLHIQPHLGPRDLKEIRPRDIQKALNDMRTRGQAASSANRVRQMLSKMFNEAVDTYRYITYNPVRGVKPFREDPKIPEHLRQDEAKTLLKWADSHPLGLAIHIGIHLGLREGEIIGLKWDAIDFPLRRLDVRRKWEKKSKTMEEFAKGKKVRTLGLPQDGLRERLQAQRDRYPDSEFVVCREGGEMISPMNLLSTLKAGIEATGVRRITIHGLRHTFGTLYMQNGGDLYDLQKLMGHQSVSTTERYRHSDPNYLRSRCGVMDLYETSAQIPPNGENGAGGTVLKLVR